MGALTVVTRDAHQVIQLDSHRVRLERFTKEVVERGLPPAWRPAASLPPPPENRAANQDRGAEDRPNKSAGVAGTNAAGFTVGDLNDLEV